MRHLFLVRHSISAPDPDRPAHTWELTEPGVRRAVNLGMVLRCRAQPSAIVCSPEPKARQTAEALGAAFDLVPVAIMPGLAEHARVSAPYFASRAAFEEQMRRLFTEPDVLVFGEETAQEALQRFETAVTEALAHWPTGDLIVVTHGTILTLFVAIHVCVDPFDFWKRLTMPWCSVFQVPGFTFIQVLRT